MLKLYKSARFDDWTFEVFGIGFSGAFWMYLCFVRMTSTTYCTRADPMWFSDSSFIALSAMTMLLVYFVFICSILLCGHLLARQQHGSSVEPVEWTGAVQLLLGYVLSLAGYCLHFTVATCISELLPTDWIMLTGALCMLSCCLSLVDSYCPVVLFTLLLSLRHWNDSALYFQIL